MSSYSSPVSSAQEDVNRPDIRYEEEGGSSVLTDVLHVHMVSDVWRLHLY